MFEKMAEERAVDLMQEAEGFQHEDGTLEDFIEERAYELLAEAASE